MDSLRITFTDCLSVPKTIGMAPILITPPYLTFFFSLVPNAITSKIATRAMTNPDTISINVYPEAVDYPSVLPSTIQFLQNRFK
jgi:hypothetical protein